ncbi:MAG: hypothetical protein ACRENG_19045 [bacterium]
MSDKIISEQELKNRLSKKHSSDQIEDLIDRYIEASSEEIPDLSTIAQLAQKSREDKLLRVSFKLTSEQYDALAAYFSEDERPATYLVKNAIEEFIREFAS